MSISNGRSNSLCNDIFSPKFHEKQDIFYSHMELFLFIRNDLIKLSDLRISHHQKFFFGDFVESNSFHRNELSFGFQNKFLEFWSQIPKEEKVIYDWI
jgi:tRNA U34 5-methylaminomethyl-2-thiouridine-forming methyltransferase MnmC